MACAIGGGARRQHREQRTRHLQEQEHGRQGGTGIYQLGAELRRQRGGDLQFDIVAVVFAVVLAEQQTVVGEVRLHMIPTRLQTGTGVQVQPHHPCGNEGQADQPECETAMHGVDFTVSGLGTRILGIPREGCWLSELGLGEGRTSVPNARNHAQYRVSHHIWRITHDLMPRYQPPVWIHDTSHAAGIPNASVTHLSSRENQ